MQVRTPGREVRHPSTIYEVRVLTRISTSEHAQPKYFSLAANVF